MLLLVPVNRLKPGGGMDAGLPAVDLFINDASLMPFAIFDEGEDDVDCELFVVLLLNR